LVYGLGFKELLYWQLVKRVIATITNDPRITFSPNNNQTPLPAA
jgi:hypothetical protein